MEEIKDFLGTPIKEGDRAIRVHEYGHLKEFKKVTISKLDPKHAYGTTVGVVGDDNTRIGWTYPKRIIVQNSLRIKI
jgi:hypothetical protein